MVLNAIVKTNPEADLSIQKIIVFDDCIKCGGVREKSNGVPCKIGRKRALVSNIECSCEVTTHDQLDQEFMIICLLAQYNISLEKLIVK